MTSVAIQSVTADEAKLWADLDGKLANLSGARPDVARASLPRIDEKSAEKGSQDLLGIFRELDFDKAGLDLVGIKFNNEITSRTFNWNNVLDVARAVGTTAPAAAPGTPSKAPAAGFELNISFNGGTKATGKGSAVGNGGTAGTSGTEFASPSAPQVRELSPLARQINAAILKDPLAGYAFTATANIARNPDIWTRLLADKYAVALSFAPPGAQRPTRPDILAASRENIDQITALAQVEDDDAEEA